MEGHVAALPWIFIDLLIFTVIHVLEKLTGLQATQEILRVLGNPKVHYRTHKRPPPVPILSQPNLVHTPTYRRSVSILSSHLRLGLLPSGFPTKTLYASLLSPIRATCPANLILLDFITRTILSEEYGSTTDYYL
jgi:hypothetical protein